MSPSTPSAPTRPAGSPRSSSTSGNSTSAPSGSRRRFPGSTSRCGSCFPLAGLLTMVAGILIGLPTLRLRGDYLAIVTLGFGEIVPQFVRNADDLGGFDLTHGTFGITPIDSLGFGVDRGRDRPAGELPPVVRALAVVLLDGGRDPPDHGLLQRAAAGLAARPRLDRDPRRRDRRRGDGCPADADEDLVVCARRLFRRDRRGLPRQLPVGRVPRRLLLPDLRLPALHGHPRRHGQRLGRAPRRHDPQLPQLRRALPRSGRRSRIRGFPGSRVSTRGSTSSGSTASSSC